METFILSYIVSLLLLVVLDAIWLKFIIKGFVKEHIGHLMADSVKMGPVIFFYPLYALGITILIVFPAIHGETELWRTFIFGALLGTISYGAYDLTNFATLKNWSLKMTVVDMAWGTFITGVVSLATFWMVSFLSY